MIQTYLVKYIVAKSLYGEFIEDLFSRSRRGELELYVSTVTLAEIFYAASRIYSVAGVEDPNREAENFVKWITLRAKPVNIDFQLAKTAGELKKKLRIALPDCFVIALAINIGGNALFKKVEREMLGIEDRLRGLGVIFAEDYIKSGHTG
ncbi:PilT domain-containing protein [Ignisphaera aggregans DSM 17230]|uniref:PilT domain-containing protein n=1 Tax=Ignisphaera aggregans (strain DSM 17230 / JCM 13409 / AQ1.S1) TaxID=583356 RepID=E0SP15_IGNAA|nr:PilT domain-containing protein [Ignisphaera aggregans DSM 17230]